MDTGLITKRLHISGLTPSITQTDLVSRLSSFGTVKDLDGFGKLDGLGQLKKFGYVTLEGTKEQLAKCTNVLSGSTWKGAKLRIGDAKPDYQERIAKEHPADPEPPRKKRKHAAGVHAPDMCLVTASNVSGRKGWHVTSMGRMVRPVRMRPERPLPPQASSATRRHLKGKAAGKDETGKTAKEKKKRVREPDVRARRRTIDPTRWDSVHLKGMFLDVVTAGRVPVETQSDGREANDADETEVTKTQEALEQDAVVAPQVRAPSQTTNLRDLFAPQEEVGFSLLGHLALDLELDDEMNIPNFSQALPVQAKDEPTSAHLAQQMFLPTPSHVSQFTYDPTLPLFFPLPSSLQSQASQQTGRQKDMFTIARERGWDPISAKFYRTESEAEIRKRWEESKGELTREWKRRSREAGKVRRRRGGWDGD